MNWLIGGLVAASIVAILGLAGVTYRNTVASLQSERAVAKSHETSSLLNELLLTIREAETGQRGFLLTDDERYLRPYRQSLQRTETLTQILQGHFANRPMQARRLAEVQRLARLKHQEIRRTIELRDSSEPNSFERAVQVVMTNEGHKLMQGIRAALEEMDREETAVLNNRIESAHRRATTTVSSILVGNLLALGLVSAAGAALRVDRRRRREAEGLLAIERERLTAIVDASMVGIVGVDERQQITLVNPAAEEIYGAQEAELRGRTVQDLLPLDGGAGILAAFEAVEKGDLKRSDFDREVSMRADGSVFVSEGSITKTLIGGASFYTFMIRDLSHEEASRETIRNQGAVLDKIRDAVHMRDVDGRITYWNRGSEQLYGWTADEAIGKRPQDLMSPERLPAHDDAERSMAETGAWLGEMRQCTHDGRELIVEQRRSALFNEQGVATGMFVINVDVTEQKKLEQQQRRNQRLESLGTLAGGIAHDLNNVLTPIMMGAKLLDRDQPEESRKQLLSAIRTSTERGAEMIRQLLAFAGGAVADLQHVDARKVLDEVTAILKHTLPKSIRLEVECPYDLWGVRGDPTELSQVLMNLAINARDAMPDGGVLSFQAANACLNGHRPTATVDLPAGRYLCLTVSDTGCGIPRRLIDRVFDPFFTTKKQGEGTGLGLATSLGITRSHGGAMNVYSEEGAGTKFMIYLPASADEDCARPAATRNDSAGGRGEVILLIDDESILLEMVRTTLKSGGYQTLVAGGGAEGVAVFQAEHGKVAAVLVDMMMPGVDGQAAIEAMRSIDPTVPIIASSGLRRPDAGDRLTRHADAFLSKPYNDEQLLRVVRRVIDNGVSSPAANDRARTACPTK